MLEIVQRPLARKDIKGIWRYTKKEWGVKQADNYVQELGQSIQRLAQTPKTGLSIYDVYEGCRVFRYRRHIVIYSVTNTSLVVQRVLHERMDITRHAIL